MMGGIAAPSRPPVPARCVLWHPESAPAPAELLRSLEKRSVEITRCTDAFAAVARLCLFERQARSGGRALTDGAGEGMNGAGFTFILIIVAPTSLPDAADVVYAAERYAPHAVCWLYEAAGDERGGGEAGGANPRLRRIVPEDVQRWARRSVPVPAAPTGRPALRLAGENGADEALATAKPTIPLTPLTGRGDAPAHRPGAAALSLSRPPAPQAPPAAPAAPGTPAASEPRPRAHSILTNEELTMLLADDVRGAAPAPKPKPRPARPAPPRGTGGTE